MSTSGSSSLPTSAVIGAAIGGILVLILIIAIVCFARRKKSRYKTLSVIVYISNMIQKPQFKRCEKRNYFACTCSMWIHCWSQTTQVKMLTNFLPGQFDGQYLDTYQFHWLLFHVIELPRRIKWRSTIPQKPPHDTRSSWGPTQKCTPR